MRRVKITHKTNFNINNSVEGETIEQKIERIVSNKEPIKDGAPLVFTEREDGVLPAYDIRTDRFDVAIEAMDLVHKSAAAKRAEIAKQKKDGEKPTPPPAAPAPPAAPGELTQ